MNSDPTVLTAVPQIGYEAGLGPHMEVVQI